MSSMDEFKSSYISLTNAVLELLEQLNNLGVVSGTNKAALRRVRVLTMKVARTSKDFRKHSIYIEE